MPTIGIIQLMLRQNVTNKFFKCTCLCAVASPLFLLLLLLVFLLLLLFLLGAGRNLSRSLILVIGGLGVAGLLAGTLAEPLGQLG